MLLFCKLSLFVGEQAALIRARKHAADVAIAEQLKVNQPSTQQRVSQRRPRRSGQATTATPKGTAFVVEFGADHATPLASPYKPATKFQRKPQ